MAERDRFIKLTEADAKRLLGSALRDGDGLTGRPDGVGNNLMFLGVALENGRVIEASVS